MFIHIAAPLWSSAFSSALGSPPRFSAVEASGELLRLHVGLPATLPERPR